MSCAWPHSLSSQSMEHVVGLVLPDDVGGSDALTTDNEGMDTCPHEHDRVALP